MKLWTYCVTACCVSNIALADQLDQCQNTEAYALFKSQNAVVDYHQAVVDIKQIQKEEREIAKEAGARDLALERSIALKIVTYRNLRDANFKHYKKLGGKAVSAGKVTREITDPCL